MKRFWPILLVLGSVWCRGQEVQVSPGNGGVVLSVRAQKGYELIAGETRTPILSVQCAQKGKTANLHIVTLTPGGTLAEDNPEGLSRDGRSSVSMTAGGVKQSTAWIPYGESARYAYLGKNEPERVKFIRLLSNSAVVSIEFKPFLTGKATSSVFDVSGLREEMDKYPECAMK